MNSYDTYKSLFRLIHQLGIPTSTKGSDFPLFYEDFIYLFLERGERNISVWLLLMHPQLGTWPATWAYALTGNQTSDPLVCRPVLNPLSHTSQG